MNVRSVSSFAIIACLLVCGVFVSQKIVLAAGGCSSQQGGIGGTGHEPGDGGIGGTGHDIEGGGIGGTGHDIEDGGIGGTGVRDGTGGIGGTGDLADGEATGIIGVITEFASICVNGVEIHFDPATPVEVDGQTATHKALAIGQVVRIVAKNVGNRMVAQKIRVDHTVSGPISRVDAGKFRNNRCHYGICQYLR